jgi:hypothetical protein
MQLLKLCTSPDKHAASKLDCGKCYSMLHKFSMAHLLDTAFVHRIVSYILSLPPIFLSLKNSTTMHFPLLCSKKQVQFAVRLFFCFSYCPTCEVFRATVSTVIIALQLVYSWKTQHMETKARGSFWKHISIHFLNKCFF